MSLTPGSAGLAAALLASGIAVPMATANSASAACLAGEQFSITHHQRVFIPVPGAKITFTHPGTHTVEIVKGGSLSARYGTNDVEDRAAIRKAVQETWPRVRDEVTVTTGHKKTFSTHKGERVTVTYETRGDRVHWTKFDVDSDCSSTVLDEGVAKFPRRNLDWVFALAQS